MGDPATLLVVDDDEAIRRLLTKRLEHEGYRVLQARDGTEAFSSVASNDVDLVVLDLMMPQITGFEVLERLRKTYEFNELPILILSAKDSGEDVISALRAGANDYAVKPPKFELLFKRIAVHLGLKKGTDKVVGKYRIQRKIGAGGMAVVYEAVDAENDRQVALKVLPRAQTLNEKFVERFLRESELASRITHPNIVKLYDAGRDDETYFIAMELVEGKNLGELREERKMSVEESLVITRQVSAALGVCAESHIIHRDIKPENIILDSDGTAKLTDFGIARNVKAQGRMTDTGVGIGSVAYASPEQFEGKGDLRTDIYSLGCTLFFMIVGDDAFTGEKPHAWYLKQKQRSPPNIAKWDPTLSRGVRDLVMRMMHPKPAKRFQTHAELIAAIDRLLERPRLLHDNRRPWWQYAAMLALVVGGALAFWKISTWG